MAVTVTRAEANALGEGKQTRARRDGPHRVVIYAARLGVVVVALGLWQLGGR
jgi:hypothetical protein